ncbi:MAG: ATP-binding protein [Deltaproteobacteria bacterium]|nr:ATP-binding protein [Deltaproteobacteria bacterium]
MDERIFSTYNSWRTGKFKLPADIVERDIHWRAAGFLKEKEIITFLGLRQTGKSTLTFQLINHLLEQGISPDDIFYFTFDDLSLRYELSASFENFIKIVERFLGEEIEGRKGLVYIFIDEVQKLPGFVEHIKALYDLKLPIKWILTGSSSLELKVQLKESLAGRVLSLSVLPFSEAEIFKGHGFTPPDKKNIRDFLFGNAEPDVKRLRKFQAAIMPHKQNIRKYFDECMIFGGLPAIALAVDREKKQILLNNYRDAYLDQDIRNLVKEDKLWVYQKVMELLSSRTGDLLNYSNIASQLEVTVDTIKRYSELLEKTFILKKLTTYSKNVRSEILKTPKIYFTDLGIRNSLLGLTGISQLEKLNQYGIVFENAIVQRLNAALPLAGHEARLHYWRTKTKEEVDIVIRTSDRLLPVEIKSDKKIQARHLKGIKSFLMKEKEKAGVLIGRFEDAAILEEGETKIYLLPYWMI